METQLCEVTTLKKFIHEYLLEKENQNETRGVFSEVLGQTRNGISSEARNRSHETTG